MSMLERKRETMGREDLEQCQLERLQALLARLRRNVPRARKVLGDVRVESLSDLPRIAPTTPAQLGKAFPYGLFALPLREVIRLNSVVGPGGMQLSIGHTRNDLSQWGRLAARQLVAAGATGHDVIQLSFAGEAFGRALGYLLGAELIEASVIPQDAYHIEYQLAMMQSYRPSILLTTPTGARELMEALQVRGIDPQSLTLRTVLLSRPVSEETRDEIKTGLFAEVRCNFGVDEVLNPGLCVECGEGRLHVNEDHFLVEIVDGELLVTTLTREAVPLLRYRTQVACSVEHAKCPCGRTGCVLRPGKRLDGRLRVNERPIYRKQIEALLADTRAAGQAFLLDIDEHRVRISLLMTTDLLPDTVRGLEALKHEITDECHSLLGIRADVILVGPRDFEVERKRRAGSDADGHAL